MQSPEFLDTVFRFLHRLSTFDLSVAAASYLLIPPGAYIAFRQQRARDGDSVGLMSFMRYCVAFEQGRPQIVTHRSCRLDIGFVIAKHFVNSWLLVPLLFSSALIANMVYHLISDFAGPRAQHSPGLALSIGMIAVCVLLQDFVQFIIHYSHHKLKLLWSVHKVHHSAEFLMLSFSVKRTHIIEEAINLTLTSAALGVAIAIMSYSYSLSIWESEIYGVDAWFLLQLFSFWHLRHSHIGLSYGWLENILQSPAQHHLHHSCEREHWDKNFGLLFSFWDKMFGCFARSVDPRAVRLGLPEADRKDYDTVLKLFLTPFLKISQALSQALAKPRAPSLRPVTVQSDHQGQLLIASLTGVVAEAELT